jgi:hypothetical protein
MTRNLCRAGLVLAALSAALPLLADSQFNIRKMTRDDVPPGKGQCDIRLQVDNEVEVTVRRDRALIRTLSGQDARDDGSECNVPLPFGPIEAFNFQVVESRNEIRLVAEPSRRDDWAAVVHIRDTAGGFGRYHFRLSWTIAAVAPPRESRRDEDFHPGQRGGGLSWNNAVHYASPGRGESRMGDMGAERLGPVSVDIDRGGRVLVSFRTEGGRALSFNGTLMAQEGDVMKADMTSENRRLRGPMFLSFDTRGAVSRITLEATDGQDRVRLNWERR